MSKQLRICLKPRGERGHITGFARLAAILEGLGHEVVFLTLTDSARDIVRSFGFATWSVDVPPIQCAASDQSGLPVDLLNWYQLRDWVYRADWRSLGINRFDLILVDGIETEFAIAFHGAKAPVALVYPQLSYHRLGATPPITSSSYRCDPATVDDLWRQVGRRRERVEQLNLDLVTKGLLPTTCARSHLAGMLHQYNLPGEILWESSYGDYPFPTGFPVVFLVPAQLELPGYFRGEHVWYLPIGSSPNTRTRGENDGQRPLVYASFGSQRVNYADPVDSMCRLMLAVAARHPEWSFAIQVPPGFEPQAALPSNCEARPMWPQLEVLNRASLFVTHGGMNSIKEALQLGVRMLVHPFKYDQPGNAARIAFHDLGDLVPSGCDLEQLDAQIATQLDASPTANRSAAETFFLPADRLDAEVRLILEKILVVHQG